MARIPPPNLLETGPNGCRTMQPSRWVESAAAAAADDDGKPLCFSSLLLLLLFFPSGISILVALQVVPPCPSHTRQS